MTFICKLLVFLNLIVGIGFAVGATATYAERPVWFTPPTEGVEKGQAPYSFGPLKTEIEANGNTANAALRAWSLHWRALQTAEKLRDSRRVEIAKLLDTARNKANGPAFFNLPEDSATKLLNLTALNDAVKGPDGQPLLGSDTLSTRFDNAVAKTIELAEQSKKARERQKALTAEIVLIEGRGIKQLEIRDELRNQAAYLASLEVNVTEMRDTTYRRKLQLIRRLETFIPK